MAVEYRELATDDDFDQASELQRRVFGFSDLELVSPLMLRLVARNNPPMGVHLGAFVTDGPRPVMVGVMIGFAAFQEKSIYAILLGVLPEYQEGLYGYRLILKFREACLSRGLETQYGVYEPLAANLGRLYVGGVGHVGTQYLNDKIFYRWDFRSEHTLAKLNRTKPAADQPAPTRSVARAEFLPEDEEVLFEIRENTPANREESRTVLGEYLNVRRYTIVDCVTTRFEGERKSYYVLRQPLGSCAP